jgi:hypothetical protein
VGGCLWIADRKGCSGERQRGNGSTDASAAALPLLRGSTCCTEYL